MKLRRVIVYPFGHAAYEAFFHTWAGTSERAYAIVEGTDGFVVACDSSDTVRFIEPLKFTEPHQDTDEGRSPAADDGRV